MSWINYEKDNSLKELPFLNTSQLGGKGFFLNPISNINLMLGGQSYPAYYRQIVYPAYHQPRQKRYYD